MDAETPLDSVLQDVQRDKSKEHRVLPAWKREEFARCCLSKEVGKLSGDDQQFLAVVQLGGAEIKAMIDTGAIIISEKLAGSPEIA